MVQVQAYYTLVDRDTAKVSRLWKGVHIFLMLAAAISGFITAYALGEVNRSFGHNCVLYSSLVFVAPETTSLPTSSLPEENTTATIRSIFDNTYTVDYGIDQEQTRWGSHSMCSFCQFTPIMSMIFALFWVTFFMMCGAGGAGYENDLLVKPWRIVYPALIFSTLFSIVLSISTIHTARGLTEFCKDFKQHVVFAAYRCIPAIDEFTRYFWKGKTREAYIHGILCFIFAHVGLAAWWSQTVLLVLRILCVVDFDMLIHKMSPSSSSDPVRTEEAAV